MAERLIKEHGGRAILAESPELVGSEPYILSRVSNEETARKFIRTTENYKEYGARPMRRAVTQVNSRIPSQTPAEPSYLDRI